MFSSFKVLFSPTEFLESRSTIHMRLRVRVAGSIRSGRVVEGIGIQRMCGCKGVFVIVTWRMSVILVAYNEGGHTHCTVGIVIVKLNRDARSPCGRLDTSDLSDKRSAGLCPGEPSICRRDNGAFSGPRGFRTD